MATGFPIEPPIEPMLAKLATALPAGDGWLFEPKWDGFRAIVFRDHDRVYIQSRDLKPLARYFPELAALFRAALPVRAVVDGEIVIAGPHGLDFDESRTACVALAVYCFVVRAIRVSHLLGGIRRREE